MTWPEVFQLFQNNGPGVLIGGFVTGVIRWLYDISQKRRNDTVQELWKLYAELKHEVEDLRSKLGEQERINDLLRSQNNSARLICTNGCWQKIDSLPVPTAAPIVNATPET